MDIKTTVQM